MPEKVALIGSGNWGSAIATKLGQNALSNDMFDSTVEMWVFEEYVKKEGDDWVRPARGAKPRTTHLSIQRSARHRTGTRQILKSPNPNGGLRTAPGSASDSSAKHQQAPQNHQILSKELALSKGIS